MALQRFKFLDENGREIPDPQPVAIPAGFQAPESLSDQIRRLVRSERMRQQAEEQGFDTFEDAEDFEIDDEMWDPSSPYEEVFDPVLGRGITAEEFQKNEGIYRQRYLEAEELAYKQMRESAVLRAIPKADQSRAASERVSNPDGGPGAAQDPKAGG